MKLTEQQVRQLAAAARVCPATVRRFVAGGEVWSRTRKRILEALPKFPELAPVVRRFGP